MQKDAALKDLEDQKKRNLEEQYNMLERREIMEKLAQMVPKINEMNQACSELKRDEYLYMPHITTKILADGQKVTSVVCKAYNDRNNPEDFVEIPFENFETIYFRVKDKYMEMMNDDLDEIDAYEAIKNDSRANDKFVFGLEKKITHDLIGYVYYFLISMYNLIETKNDETPIIDVKGNIKGRVSYSVYFEGLDPFTLNPIELEAFDNLSEMIGKKLKVTLELKKASDIPEKQQNEVYAKYQWVDDDRTDCNTGPCKDKTTTPVWNYRKEHVITVDEDLVNHCMTNTLTIGVYGL